MRIFSWQTILMKYNTLFFQKLGKMLQNSSSTAVVIGALRIKFISNWTYYDTNNDSLEYECYMMCRKQSCILF